MFTLKTPPNEHLVMFCICSGHKNHTIFLELGNSYHKVLWGKLPNVLIISQGDPFCIDLLSIKHLSFSTIYFSKIKICPVTSKEWTFVRINYSDGQTSKRYAARKSVSYIYMYITIVYHHRPGMNTILWTRDVVNYISGCVRTAMVRSNRFQIPSIHFTSFSAVLSRVTSTHRIKCAWFTVDVNWQVITTCRLPYAQCPNKPFEKSCYGMLFLKSVSHGWNWVSSMELSKYHAIW